MTFPRTPLPVRVRIAPGGNPAASPATWTWVDITSSVRVSGGITITAGRSDEGNKVDPGKCTLTLDNRSGNYSTRNALGQWYGQLAKGTPIRVGTISGAASFTSTVSNGWPAPEIGTSWTLPGSASDWSSSGGMGRRSLATANLAQSAILVGADCRDGDATFVVSSAVVATGGPLRFGLQTRYTDSSDHLHVRCELGLSGAITGVISRQFGGSLTTLASASAGITYSAGERIKVRVQWDGGAVRLRIWKESATEPTTWTATATDTKCQGAGVALRSWRDTANTNAGAVVFSWDDLEIEALEFTGSVIEWPPRWDKSRRDATAPITAAGILRRLQQGKSPLRSPIARMMLRNNPIAYWPLEDDSQATTAASALPGGKPASARAVEFGKTEPVLAAAKTVAGITASMVLAAGIPSHTYTGAWGVVFFAYLLAPPAATTRIMTVTASGTVRTWGVELDSVGIYLRGWNVDGTKIFDAASAYPAQLTPPRWIAFDLFIEQIAGSIWGTLLMYGIDGQPDTPTMFFNQTSISGTIGSPTGWRMEGSLGFNEGAASSVAVFNYEPEFVTYAFAAAANGYVGETASERIQRLCTEESVQVVVEDGASERCGPQRVDTFLNLLYAAEAADVGILYERGAGLGYRPRGARENRPVELPLDFAIGDVAEAPEPVDDDQQLRNQWTVTRDGGSSAVAQNDESIAISGLLDDSVTVNVDGDGRLPDHATWRLATDTIDEYRWPLIALNMARNSQQIPLWRAAKPFPRATIANVPAQAAGVVVDITALGHTQRLEAFGWDVELNCGPSTPWTNIGIRDDAGSRRDSTSTTLGVSRDAVQTSWTFSTANTAETWSTAGGDYPLDLNCGGERITVTAMGAVSGSGPYLQTATVTRSVNGIAKAQSAGTQISLWRPVYRGL